MSSLLFFIIFVKRILCKFLNLAHFISSLGFILHRYLRFNKLSRFSTGSARFSTGSARFSTVTGSDAPAGPCSPSVSGQPRPSGGVVECTLRQLRVGFDYGWSSVRAR